MKKSIFKKILKIIVYIFAIWGFLLTFVFFAMKFGFTKAKSAIDNESEYFKKLYLEKKENINSIKIKEDNKNISIKNFEYIKSLSEWDTVEKGILKDKELIKKVSDEIGIEERILISPLVVEQLRLMTSEREVFKRYFEPLSILGNQTQFSLGIYGIKEETAEKIENNLKNKESKFYLGKDFENILDYRENVNINKERINRLTNEKDHYYSYLYAAIYLKQILNSWKNAGYDINDRPEILSTLYNIGFENSRPNADPKVGGAEINLYENKFTFGSLAFYFYFSEEMMGVFPR